MSFYQPSNLYHENLPSSAAAGVHPHLLTHIRLPPLIRPNSHYCLKTQIWNTNTQSESPCLHPPPNYIITPCLIVLVQLRRRRAFVWPVECGTLGIFQRKGSFLDACAKRRSRGWDHGCWCPLLRLLFLALSSSILSASESPDICTIPSVFWVHKSCQPFTSAIMSSHSSLCMRNVQGFSASDDKSRQVAVLDTNRAAPASDNPPWGRSSAVLKESICFSLGSSASRC